MMHVKTTIKKYIWVAGPQRTGKPVGMMNVASYVNAQLKTPQEVCGDDYFCAKPRLLLNVNALPPLVSLPPSPPAEMSVPPSPVNLLRNPLILDQLKPSSLPIEAKIDRELAETHCIINYNPLRFLVVDDNIINVKVLKKILHKLYPNAVLHSTTDLTQVTRVMSTHQFDCVFLDIDMPVLTGVDLAKMIRSQPCHRQVGLVAVTTRTSASDLATYNACGIDYTVDKPIRLGYNVMLERIDQVMHARSNFA